MLVHNLKKNSLNTPVDCGPPKVLAYEIQPPLHKDLYESRPLRSLVLLKIYPHDSRANTWELKCSVWKRSTSQLTFFYF